ncbi:unnamed protein product [Dracunculus medinensis]|uniref:E3 ubiquitin-protein ligase PPP1R11 n=1 Tax=Dracunculus medinensis TaxID=318479 RepID=A0A0N4UF01_DRAME|nr:unnamed protein product [Dracunculus medinensis]
MRLRNPLTYDPLLTTALNDICVKQWFDFLKFQTTVTLIPPETGAMPRVSWRADTVDNEFLGKHKSKCCCIYKKPKRWSDESDSDSDCETSHCRGHVEKRCGRHDGGAGDSDGRGQGIFGSPI